MHAMNKRKKKRGVSGFTLVELMVVVAIIAILATTAGVYAFESIKDADRVKAQAEIKAMKTCITQFMLKNNRKLPETLEQIAMYMDPQKIPEDPWGNPYVYTREGSQEYTIVSYGADGRPGGDDIDLDISSRD